MKDMLRLGTKDRKKYLIISVVSVLVIALITVSIIAVQLRHNKNEKKKNVEETTVHTMMVQETTVQETTEEGTTEEIFEHPTHPYTRALLHAIPKCESGCRERLEPIPGMAPSLAHPPAGCPFVTRCRFACEECKKGIPSMRAYSDTQSSRCIFTKEELDEKEKKEEEK